MQLKTIFYFLLACFFGLNVHAEVKIENQKVVPYATWGQQFPVEKELLNIFPTFTPPTVTFMRYGVEKSRLEEYHTYIVQLRKTINKSAAQLPLADLVKLDTIKKMTAEIQHKQIGQNEVVPLLAGRAPINNFKWCNGWVETFGLPQKEKNLTHMINPARPWCAANGRTICVESCYNFSLAWKAAVAAHNQFFRSDEPKDFGLAMQSEIRYFVSEAEYGNRTPLSQLTKINTPVRGVIEQSIFYYNMVFTWGKVVAVFQEHPTNSQQSIMTAYVVFNLRSKYWNHKYKQVRQVLQGESKGQDGLPGVNTDTGISAGIPVFSKEVGAWLANTLEK